MSTALSTSTTPESIAASEHEQAEQVLSVIRSFKIVTVQDHENAVLMLAEAKKERARIEEIRTGITRPINQSLKKINELFKPIDITLGATIQFLNEAVVGWIEEQTRERDRLLREAAEAAQAGASIKAADAIFQAQGSLVPQVDGFSVRDVWSGEVVDAALLPREYLIPDVTKLLAETREKKDKMNVPGWKVTSRKTTVSR